MKELGFNLNFAPVAEFQDKSYGGRAFSGTKEEIKEKLKSYIKGLQKNVYGTCKHYPGKGMIKNLHIWKDKQKIGKDDLELFNTCINENISSIMIGHQIVFGEIDSKGKQSTISKPIISNLRSNFSGLIITDEINMLGLKFNYLFSSDKMYIDLIKAGNDVILDFSSYKKVEKRIKALENAVKKGEISEKRIDESVKRILEKKRYSID